MHSKVGKFLLGRRRKEQRIWLPPSDLDSQDWSAHLLMDRGLHGCQAHLYSEACQHLLTEYYLKCIPHSTLLFGTLGKVT